jgi:hypothetical protein
VVVTNWSIEVVLFFSVINSDLQMAKVTHF